MRFAAAASLGLFVWAVPAGAVGAVVGDARTRCAAIEDPDDRLACYDQVARAEAEKEADTLLERHWDLADREPAFRPWPHRPNYILPARWTSAPNEAPFREIRDDPASSEPQAIQSVETKFQISFKTKIWRTILGSRANLWFGYTQQSHWQLYNASASRPFRETDYEPEVMLVAPMGATWGSWTWRVAGVGFDHQSNGRGEPLSRSWNRVDVLIAGETPRVAFHFRAWARIDHGALSDDDNPGIESYVGRCEAVVTVPVRGHVLNARLRSNLDIHGHRGSLQVDWFFPIKPRLHGQVQAFTGYGESLIDYNHRQTTLGVGLLLFDRM